MTGFSGTCRSASVLMALLMAVLMTVAGDALADAAVIDSAELAALPQERLILDVRTEGEFSRGHIKDAVNLNIHDPDFRANVAELDRDQPYVVHCGINSENGRAAQAMAIMSELGFTNVKGLSGGYNAWSTSGRPVQLGSPAADE